jgi:predicted DNA-binding transcriptional regulator YafY
VKTASPGRSLATEPRRVAQRVVLTLLRVQERARSAIELIQAIRDVMGDQAYGTQPLYALRRDIQCLRGAGFEIAYARPAGVYQLNSSPLTMRLGEAQARALAIVRQAFQPGVPHAAEVQELVARVAELLPEAERRLLQREPTTRLELGPADRRPASPSLIERLEHAVGWGLQTKFRYQSPRWQETAPLVLEPRELTFRHGPLYLRGYDLQRHESREYRVDRIQAGTLEILPTRRPPGRRSPKRYRLRYRLSPALARLDVSERFPGQQVEMLHDGGALVSAEIESLFWAERTLLAYGDQVEVLEPPELREALRATVQRMARLYANERD